MQPSPNSASSRLLAALDLMSSALDDALAADPALESDDDLLSVLQGWERLRNRGATLDHALILDVERRGLAHQLGARRCEALLQQLLRITAGEARARVSGAQAVGLRTALTGEQLEPAFPDVAAAQASGAISPRHAAVIVRCVDSLPGEAQVAVGEQIEQELVGHAHDFDPTNLARIAHRINYLHDQDGADPVEHARQRSVIKSSRVDGSATGSFSATAELGELLDVVFDAFAAPQPAADGAKDPRTAPQRRHDALVQALQIAVRSDELPSVNGVAATVVVHITEESWRTGAGLATTGHGALVPASDAIRWAAGDAQVMGVVFNDLREIVAYSSLHRIADRRQRLAVAARDLGCSFPGCTAPTAWCQLHHMREWRDDGATRIDNLTLVCAHDHRERIAQGWTAELINGRPAWTPPAWLDPDRRPRYNRVHEPCLV